MRLALAILSLGNPLVGYAHAQATPEPSVAIRGAAVVDVETGRVHPAMTVVVVGNTIRAVGPMSSTPIPVGARVIEARGKYLIPGMIDTHVHLFQAWNRNWPDTVAQLGWIVAGGVTTVRDAAAGGLEANYVALNAAGQTGRIVAPRILVSGFVRQVMGRESARTMPEALARFSALGLSQVKIRGAPKEEALATIRAARAVGLPVYGHTAGFPTATTTEDYALAAVQAGISGLSHISRRFAPDGITITPGPPITYQSSIAARTQADLRQLSGWLTVDQGWQRALIDSMIAHKTWLEPTLVVTYHDHEALYDQCAGGYDLAAVQRYYTFATSVPKATFTRSQADTVRRICSAINAFIRQFHSAGGMIVTGTDYPPFAPLGVTEEMRLLVYAGLSPLAALQAATVNAARAVGMENEIGTIDIGKLADLVLLDGDPRADVGNVRRVAAVMANGRLVDREQLLARVGTSPPMTSYDDQLDRLDGDVRALSAQQPDSVVELLIYTDGTMRPEDQRGIAGPNSPVRILSVDAGVVRVRAPAFAARIISRIRFVTRIRLAGASQ